MALFKEVKCGRCDRRYSALRSRCPHCGARKNRDGKASTVESGTRWQVIVGAVVLLAIIAAAIILIVKTTWTGCVPSFTLVQENFPDWKSWLLLAAAFAASFWGKVNPILLILAGAVLGLLLY